VAALRFCHGRCIVYRDVKPENVLLDEGSPPTLRLCDFGVARRWGAAVGPHGMTTVAGTPGYWAPQVLGCMFNSGAAGSAAAGSAAGGAAYNGAAADVWSAGALLSELLLQRLPYDFDSFAAATAPTAALSRVWERAKGSPWRDASSDAPMTGGGSMRGGRAAPLSASVLDLLDGMLHPDEHSRLTLDAVAAHPWVVQPLDAAHEGALAALAARQAVIKRCARLSGVYSRADGDGVIAAVVQRASAHESMRELAAAAADAAEAAASGGGLRRTAPPSCIRLRLEDVPRMQCPPSLHNPRYGDGGRIGTQQQQQPPSPGGSAQRGAQFAHWRGGGPSGGGSASNSGTFPGLAALGLQMPPSADGAAAVMQAQLPADKVAAGKAGKAGWWANRAAARAA
jgi:hypothetical protein